MIPAIVAGCLGLLTVVSVASLMASQRKELPRMSSSEEETFNRR